jgi:hypothetical protein
LQNCAAAAGRDSGLSFLIHPSDGNGRKLWSFFNLTQDRISGPPSGSSFILPPSSFPRHAYSSPEARLHDLIAEVNEILAMTVASIKTLRDRDPDS